ncbi:MAG: hypothetical protein AAF728_19645 [Cyanobacteria bacterium P01_D01_bin.128]
MTYQHKHQVSRHYQQRPPQHPATTAVATEQGWQNYSSDAVGAHSAQLPAQPGLMAPAIAPRHQTAFYPPQSQEFQTQNLPGHGAQNHGGQSQIFQPPTQYHSGPVPMQGQFSAAPHGALQAKSQNSRRPRTGYFLAGGSISMLAAMALLVFPGQQQQSAVNTEPALCQEVVKEDARMSRSNLSQVLAIDERSPKEKVTEILAEPYCVLETLSVREGVPARREAYPLEFDIDTWFVVLYEDGEYAGYDFSFRNR